MNLVNFSLNIKLLIEFNKSFISLLKYSILNVLLSLVNNLLFN